MSDETRLRLLAAARRYQRQRRSWSRLAPYREVLLLQRAKFMTVREIAATLTEHGVKVAPNTVAVYCRRHLRAEEIEAKRRELAKGSPG